MNYELQKLKSEVTATITIDVSEWDATIESVYNKTKFKYSVPGFRKGKVPRRVIEKNYGEGVFFEDAFNEAASNAYSKILDENTDIYPVSNPVPDVLDFPTEDKPMKFTLKITVMPEVKLGAYKGLEVEKAEYPVETADIDAEIESNRKRASRTVTVADRAVADGDTVNLDYSGSTDGVKFEGGTAQGQTLVIGSGSFIPGFEPQLVGMKIGETKDITVKFPDDYHAENLKGKDAVFTVTVNGITVQELPELNDAFAKDTSKFETFAEYKKDIEATLIERNTQRADSENKNKLLETVVNNAEVEIPECMVEDMLEDMLKDFEYRLMYMYRGMKLEDYFKYTNSSPEAFKKERRDEALNSVKTRLVVRELIKAENLDVTDADLDAHIQKIAEKSGKSVEEYKKTLNDGRINEMRNTVIIDKMYELLNSFNGFVAKKKTAAKKITEKTTENTPDKSAATKTATKKKND